MAEYAGGNEKKGEGEPARLNQDILEAKSTTAEYAGARERRVEVDQASLNQDTIKVEAGSPYDVFLSYTKSDDGFAHRLYDRLNAEGIRVFIYDEDICTSEELPLPVYSSKICIPFFSRNYAYSPRCLDALALMVELTSRSRGKKEIMPVLFHVNWSDVTLETSLYRDALDKHTKSSGNEKVMWWKQALMEAGNVEGWKLGPYESEGERITLIVGNILYRLMIENNYGFEDLSISEYPKMPYRTLELEDSQELKIMELLELEVKDVRIVGIHGRDGIGKTVLAKDICHKISLHFDACSFLVDIEETTQQPGGIQYLQTKLIFDILKREYEVASAFKGVRFFKEIFRNMKILIVLDDVERLSVLKEFVGAKLDWFGPGSRIIVTSKESKVLQGFVARGLAHTYDVSSMDDNRAFDFFWWVAATGKRDELRSYVKIAIEIVKAARGLPLLLKVFRSFLRNKGQEEWIKFKDLMQQFPEDYQKILRIIYDALDQEHKEMYLDIACFIPEVDGRVATYMWPDHYCYHCAKRSCEYYHYYYHKRYDIKVLRDMSLVEIEKDKIGMHSMLRCLAREIIRGGFHDPGTGVGLYTPAISQDTNKGKKGTDRPDTEAAGFEFLPNTTFLSLGRANIGGQFVDALLNVRWLHWQGCPREAISIHLEKNENLRILDLSCSKVTESWGGWKKIKMAHLKVLNLTCCTDLLVTPSFSCWPNLEILVLERCSRLVHLDPSINDLKHLLTLNLKFCTELSMLPVEMGGMNTLKELLIDGTSIRELPTSIGKLVQLQILSATDCISLVHVLDSVRECKALLVLALDDAKILELPKSIGYMGRLGRLSLSNCRGLGKLPESIGELDDSLIELDISGTGISRLPDSINYLRKLEVLKMDSCFLREFPRHIGRLERLEEVRASWCRSMEGAIPSVISKLPRLRELRLRGTRISSLPSEIKFMTSLQTLDLLHCDLLKELPTLPSSLINCDFIPTSPSLPISSIEPSLAASWAREWDVGSDLSTITSEGSAPSLRVSGGWAEGMKWKIEMEKRARRRGSGRDT